METGTIILIPFPFAELTNIKVRPALVVTTTKDKHKDLIVCAISSVLPSQTNHFEIILKPSKTNNLRVKSVIKIDRIVTLKEESVIGTLGILNNEELEEFKIKFKALID